MKWLTPCAVALACLLGSGDLAAQTSFSSSPSPGVLSRVPGGITAQSAVRLQLRTSNSLTTAGPQGRLEGSQLRSVTPRSRETEQLRSRLTPDGALIRDESASGPVFESALGESEADAAVLLEEGGLEGLSSEDLSDEVTYFGAPVFE